MKTSHKKLPHNILTSSHPVICDYLFISFNYYFLRLITDYLFLSLLFSMFLFEYYLNSKKNKFSIFSPQLILFFFFLARSLLGEPIIRTDFYRRVLASYHPPIYIGNFPDIVKEVEDLFLKVDALPFVCIVNPPRHGKSLFLDRIFSDRDDFRVVEMTYNNNSNVTSSSSILLLVAVHRFSLW